MDRFRQAARRRRGEADHLLLARYGEDYAHRYLQQAGASIVARNYRRRGGHGELDLIAVEDGATLVFVEVKTRSAGDLADPERAVTLEKERLLGRTAAEYMRFAKAENLPVRFDIINIIVPVAGARYRTPAIEHVRDAFYSLERAAPADTAWR